MYLDDDGTQKVAKVSLDDKTGEGILNSDDVSILY